MKHVGMFEAKTNLSSLVEEVEKGGEITITRHGKPVAKLVAAEDPIDTRSRWHSDARRSSELREIANRLKINATQEEIKSWIEEGRH